jgi:predicted transcriptional regulator
MKTINQVKDKIIVSQELKDKQKEYRQIKKAILKTLETGPKNIPQIAVETRLSQDIVTFHVMTLRKYGEIEVDELDDMDEYFTYKVKNK